MEAKNRPLSEVLTERREHLTEEWLALSLRSYPEATTRFLNQERDAFRNPVGHTFREGLERLFDGLAGNKDVSVMTSVLDSIIRIRAVQDFTASQAVSFVFLLKQVIREELKDDAGPYSNDLSALETRIDELALLAFDLFMQCRQQICEIRANEARRRVSLLERCFQAAPAEPTR